MRPTPKIKPGTRVLFVESGKSFPGAIAEVHHYSVIVKLDNEKKREPEN